MKTLIIFILISSWANASENFVPNEYLVKVKSGLSLASLGAEKVEKIPSLDRWYKVVSSKGLKTLSENQSVEVIEPNYVYTVDRIPNDSNFKYQWGLRNYGQQDNDGHKGEVGVDIDVEDVWNVTTGSSDVVVAVIDTGIDYAHKDLKPNAWINLKELNGKPGVDDDGNGYIDDVYGYSFVESSSADPKDDNGHGTHCAGVIGARGDDNVGIAGVNWKVRLMPVKFLSKDGMGNLEGALKSIAYAVDNGAKILSNSWGGGAKSVAMSDAIKYAMSKGAIFIAAAGNAGADNDQEPHFPSSYEIPNIISVAAINNVGDLADFSNFGIKSVSLAAPGVNILSTLPTDIYEDWSGTSMATPFVSGVAALMLSVNKNLDFMALKTKILGSVRPMKSLNGKVLTGGLLNARGAVSKALKDN